MGSSSAYSTAIDGHQVTVIGEVPQRTVQFIASQVRAPQGTLAGRRGSPPAGAELSSTPSQSPPTAPRFDGGGNQRPPDLPPTPAFAPGSSGGGAPLRR